MTSYWSLKGCSDPLCWTLADCGGALGLDMFVNFSPREFIAPIDDGGIPRFCIAIKFAIKWPNECIAVQRHNERMARIGKHFRSHSLQGWQPPKLSAGFTKSNENNRQKDDESINCSWSRSCDVASRMTIPPSTYWQCLSDQGQSKHVPYEAPRPAKPPTQSPRGVHKIQRKQWRTQREWRFSPPLFPGSKSLPSFYWWSLRPFQSYRILFFHLVC